MRPAGSMFMLTCRRLLLCSCSGGSHCRPRARDEICRALGRAVFAGCVKSRPHLCYGGAGLKVLTDEEVDALVAELDAEKAAADAARRQPGSSTTS